jgi:hypothetical protein
MKISIDIDCTPEEARRFLGLPDLTEVNATFAAALRERIEETVKAMDPETFVKTWLPAGMKGLEEMQRAFWQSFATAAGGADKTKGR